ncbi:ATP-binding protein, partial [Candidatus Poribacteria bacterium]|nr:ATP-binding protein [Candidatus Poribacteria bacterium]
MNHDTIFTVRNEDLTQLNQNTAVEFFQKLLWAEARRLGIEISKINVSRWVNVPDGGVDATVDDVPSATGQGIIKHGKTSYQIKSVASFKPCQESEIKKVLFGDKIPEKQSLGESIRVYLGADNSTYILVCTGIDLVDSQRRDALEHIENFLKQCGDSDPKVEVWSQNTLIGFLQVFPSLALSVNGRGGLNFQTHQSWTQDANMHVPYVSGEGQEDSIAKIRDELRQNYDTLHVRVLGEPGIGKTRLVLEATRTEDLAPLVIYCPAAQFRGSDLMREILREDSRFSAIVVIDECDPSNSLDFWDKLRHRGPQIKLISIYNEHEVRAGGITYHDTLPLNDEQIRSIIQKHITTISNAEADRWSELCGGSPRVAHVIGENLVNHPEDLLKPPSTVNIWERYVAAGDDREKTEHRRLVLQYLALFKRFGYERSVAKEAEAIAEKIKSANANITSHEFENIIYELRERRILQGESTLYITPKALQIWLWVQWWERHYRLFDLEDFTRDLPAKLIEWFYEMFVYAAESDAASRIVEDLLGPNGPFRDDEYLKTRLGSRFFLALTEADPKSALRCLMRTMGTWDRDTIFQFTSGRRDVVWALEKIAMKRDLFADAARLLLALGEAENEGWSNNASGVFASLFSPGRGRVAPTEASPAERLPVLKEAFESGSKERRLLALKACNEGLEFDHFSRMSGA